MGVCWVSFLVVVGFVDLFYSLGIVYIFLGIECFVSCFEFYVMEIECELKLVSYGENVFGEIELIDELIYVCY